MPIGPSTSWREDVRPDEDRVFREYADRIRAMRVKAAGGDAKDRSLHTKAHLGARATLDVRADLPEELRVSFFATPGPKRCLVRYSNGLGRREADRMPDVRGLAVKILDVPGPKIITGLEHATTQDFLLITVPAFPVGTPEEFMKVLDAAERGPLHLAPRMMKNLGVGRGLSVVWKIATMPGPKSLAGARFHTVAPLRFGAWAGKLALFPLGGGGARRGRGRGPASYREDLVARLAEGPIAYELKLQRFVDERTTPIEDVSVEWPEDVAPWETLGTLTVPRTDVTSDEGRAAEAEVEALSFDPWHATEELRPLGAVMRARRFAYATSAIARGAAEEP